VSVPSDGMTSLSFYIENEAGARELVGDDYVHGIMDIELENQVEISKKTFFLI